MKTILAAASAVFLMATPVASYAQNGTTGEQPTARAVYDSCLTLLHSGDPDDPGRHDCATAGIVAVLAEADQSTELNFCLPDDPKESSADKMAAIYVTFYDAHADVIADSPGDSAFVYALAQTFPCH